MTVRELEQAVRRLLDEGQGPAEENRLGVSDLKTNFAEWFDELDDLFSRAPGERDQPQATLWVMDADPDQPVSFAAAVCTAKDVELAVGHGDAQALQAFMEGHAHARGAGLFEALGTQFSLHAARLQAPRLTVNAWVGYEP